MEVINTPLEGVLLIKPKIFKDERGFFLESFQKDLYDKAGISIDFVQDNHSFSHKNCIRGLHFQSFPGQAKLVRVVSGEIWDIAVDLRPHSKTYLKWYAAILNADNHHQLFIPNGFAHGFCVLKEAHVLYKVSSFFSAEHEKSIRYNDPDIQIPWPISSPILSIRDATAPFLKDHLKAIS